MVRPIVNNWRRRLLSLTEGGLRDELGLGIDWIDAFFIPVVAHLVNAHR